MAIALQKWLQAWKWSKEKHIEHFKSIMKCAPEKQCKIQHMQTTKTDASLSNNNGTLKCDIILRQHLRETFLSITAVMVSQLISVDLCVSPSSCLHRAPPAGLDHFHCIDLLMQRFSFACVLLVCICCVSRRFPFCTALDDYLHVFIQY